MCVLPGLRFRIAKMTKVVKAIIMATQLRSAVCVENNGGFVNVRARRGDS